MTPLERAARAVQEADGAYAHENGLWMKEGGLVDDGHWKDIVRAVLEAIREPSEGMREAGAEVGEWHDNLPRETEPHAAADVYRAMIDAALKEG